MSVTNLTGTTWVLNQNNISFLSDGPFYFQFESNGMYCDGINVENHHITGVSLEYLGATYAYANGEWIDEAYRTISIIDGDDVENSNLISWFEANAVQQENSGGGYGHELP